MKGFFICDQQCRLCVTNFVGLLAWGGLYVIDL